MYNMEHENWVIVHITCCIWAWALVDAQLLLPISSMDRISASPYSNPFPG